jgi:hypothetical protein
VTVLLHILTDEDNPFYKGRTLESLHQEDNKDFWWSWYCCRQIVVKPWLETSTDSFVRTFAWKSLLCFPKPLNSFCSEPRKGLIQRQARTLRLAMQLKRIANRILYAEDTHTNEYHCQTQQTLGKKLFHVLRHDRLAPACGKSKASTKAYLNYLGP